MTGDATDLKEAGFCISKEMMAYESENCAMDRL
jgi:hypothetical protein